MIIVSSCSVQCSVVSYCADVILSMLLSLQAVSIPQCALGGFLTSGHGDSQGSLRVQQMMYLQR